MATANRNLRTLALVATMIAAPVALLAQNSYPQPYNSDDPNNYGSPAAQAYDQQYPQQLQQPAYDDQQGYDDQQQGYDGQQLVNQPPPALPDYDQPECPGEGYIWTPGYWAYGPAGYYWVPGAWVLAPYQGALWTPGYWGIYNGGYFWNAGYWGPTVGFYGGINYGFGYFGTGFYGGYWSGPRFYYNSAYWHVGGRVGGGYYFNRPYPGVGGAHPGGGRSFTTVNVSNNFHGGAGFTRGSYNNQGSFNHNPNTAYQNQQRGFANTQPNAGSYNRGASGSQGFQQQGNSYNHGYQPQQQNYNRGQQQYAQPQYRQPTVQQQARPQQYAQPQQQRSAPQQQARPQSFSGAGRGASAPQPHFSAPSGGGGFHGGGGGGFHGGPR